jgi:hypothetical protein
VIGRNTLIIAALFIPSSHLQPAEYFASLAVGIKIQLNAEKVRS